MEQMLKDGYKAWDECSDCDDCELIRNFLLLVDAMMHDIKHLRAEVVRTRYILSEQSSYPLADGLKGDILSDISVFYDDNPAFQEYMRIMYDGGNPLDFDDYVKSIKNIAEGKDNFKY